MLLNPARPAATSATQRKLTSGVARPVRRMQGPLVQWHAASVVLCPTVRRASGAQQRSWTRTQKLPGGAHLAGRLLAKHGRCRRRNRALKEAYYGVTGIYLALVLRHGRAVSELLKTHLGMPCALIATLMASS